MSESHDDPLIELWTLTSALRAHAEQFKRAGGYGLTAGLSKPLEDSPPEPPRQPVPRASAGAPDAASSRRPAPRIAQPPAPSIAQPPAQVAGNALPARRPEPSVGAPAVAAGAEPIDRGAAQQALVVLQEQVSSCTACGLHRTRTQTVFARGYGSSGVCFIGEGPGADEDAQGLPFVGKAGQLLDRMISAMGLSRDEVYVCNIVKCRPPDNRKPDLDEMRACMPYLEQQLGLIKPQVIVALGATAVQGLLGTTGGITRLRGRWRLYQGKLAVMPTFHPAYLLRNPRAKRDVWDDLQEVMRHLGRPIPSRS